MSGSVAVSSGLIPFTLRRFPEAHGDGVLTISTEIRPCWRWERFDVLAAAMSSSRSARDGSQWQQILRGT